MRSYASFILIPLLFASLETAPAYAAWKGVLFRCFSRGLRVTPAEPASTELERKLAGLELRHSDLRRIPRENGEPVYLARLPDGTQVIVKTAEADALSEIAAYRFAREAGFDVPVTVPATVDGKPASFQLFIEGHPTARQLRASGKPAAEPDLATRVFDVLIGNADRNSGNYLVREDGSQILIDHAFAFRGIGSIGVFHNPTLDLSRMREFVQRYPAIAAKLSDPAMEERFIEAVSGIGSHEQIEAFRERLVELRATLRLIR